MTSKAALVPMQDTVEASVDTPNVFIALDLMSEANPNVRHVVGHFIGWERGKMLLSLPDDAAVLLIPKSSIIRGYWAPVGYRPE